MVKQQNSTQSGRQVMSGMERLSLRVCEVINQPLAQLQRWANISRLEGDGDREWDEVVRVLSQTEELCVDLNDDGSITVRWDGLGRKTRGDEFEELEMLPYTINNIRPL